MDKIKPKKWGELIDWSGVTGDQGEKMVAAQNRWDNLVAESKKLTSVVAQDFENFMRKQAHCKSMLDLESATPTCQPDFITRVNFKMATFNF